MRKTWMSSVVAGLLVLAPIAAVAQSGGQEVEEGDGAAVVRDEVTEAKVDTLELVAETETNTGDIGLEQEDTTDTVDDGRASDDHGERVSTVAQCAPTGKLDIEGFRNHGSFVRAVAKGESIDVPGAGTFDLSTAADVTALCDWAATYEPPSEDPVEATSAEGGTEAEGRPEGAGPPAERGKPDHAAARTNGEGNGRNNGKGNGKSR